MSPESPGAAIGHVRSLFPHTARGILYLNHAATTPLSTRVVDAMTRHLRDRSEGRIETYPADMRMVGECKTLLARLIHAGSPDRIALTANTSDALNIVASGVPWRAGDRVIIGRFEFPANVWPYLNLRRLGVEIDFLLSDDGAATTDAVAAAIRPGTRMVALSAVQYLSGHRTDLAAIGSLCRERDIRFVVDGIQGIGAIDIDVGACRIDALAAGGQKWQTAPHGNGFLFITEEFQHELRPPSLGWLAVDDPWRFTDYDQPPASSARRFEGGSLNMPGLWGYHAALSTLMEFGIQAIEQRITHLAGRLIRLFAETDGIEIHTPLDPSRRAGIVTIRPGQADPVSLFRRLLRRDVTVALREGMLRFSPHFYNTDEELDSAVGILKEELNSGAG